VYFIGAVLKFDCYAVFNFSRYLKSTPTAGGEINGIKRKVI